MGTVSQITLPQAKGRGKGMALLDMLFTRTQQRVLGLLFGHPDRQFHVNEIIALSGVGRGAVSRELLRLESSRLATAVHHGRTKRYQANRQAAIYSELRGLIRKTSGCAAIISEALAPLRDDLDLAFIFGSVPKGTETATSDADLLVVSDRHGAGCIYPHLLNAMGDLNRKIELVHYTRNQFRERYLLKDGFLRRVLESPVIFLAGSMETVDALCA